MTGEQQTPALSNKQTINYIFSNGLFACLCYYKNIILKRRIITGRIKKQIGQDNVNSPVFDQTRVISFSGEIISFHTGKYMDDLIYLNIRKLFKLLPHKKLLVTPEKIGKTYENCKL